MKIKRFKFIQISVLVTYEGEYAGGKGSINNTI